jgi:hypothetical protein
MHISLSVIVRLDRTIQNILKILDSVLRLDRGINAENDGVYFIVFCEPETYDEFIEIYPLSHQEMFGKGA